MPFHIALSHNPTQSNGPDQSLRLQLTDLGYGFNIGINAPASGKPGAVGCEIRNSETAPMARSKAASVKESKKSTETREGYIAGLSAAAGYELGRMGTALEGFFAGARSKGLRATLEFNEEGAEKFFPGTPVGLWASLKDDEHYVRFPIPLDGSFDAQNVPFEIVKGEPPTPQQSARLGSVVGNQEANLATIAQGINSLQQYWNLQHQIHNVSSTAVGRGRTSP